MFGNDIHYTLWRSHYQNQNSPFSHSFLPNTQIWVSSNLLHVISLQSAANRNPQASAFISEILIHFGHLDYL